MVAQSLKSEVDYKAEEFKEHQKYLMRIREEFEELLDGVEQNNKVLIICELCDMLGAIEAYASKFNLTLSDLEQMMNCTKSAFIEGKR